jgi:hypothetical protein
MKFTLTLQSAYSGETYSAGPFNISGTTSGGTTYQLATGVTKSQLLTGYTVSTSYETITGGTIQSTGNYCVNSQTYYINELGTVTLSTSFGSYPISTPGYDAEVLLTNNSGGVLYVYVWTNTASANSGTLSDYFTIHGSFSINLNYSIISNGYDAYSYGYDTIPDGETRSITIVKGSYDPSGPLVRLAVSKTAGGTKTNLTYTNQTYTI